MNQILDKKVMSGSKVEEFNYFKSIQNPLVLLIGYYILNYMVSYFLIGNIPVITNFNLSDPNIKIMLIMGGLTVFGVMVIMFYLGGIIYSKYKGTIRNAITAILLLSEISLVLSFINSFIKYLTFPGVSSKMGIIPVIGSLAFVQIKGIIIYFPLYTLSGIFGYFIAKRLRGVQTNR